MLNQTTPFCNCAECPGAGCTCGCQAGLATAALAAPPQCACAASCACEGAEQGCLCRPSVG